MKQGKFIKRGIAILLILALLLTGVPAFATEESAEVPMIDAIPIAEENIEEISLETEEIQPETGIIPLTGSILRTDLLPSAAGYVYISDPEVNLARANGVSIFASSQENAAGNAAANVINGVNVLNSQAADDAANRWNPRDNRQQPNAGAVTIHRHEWLVVDLGEIQQIEQIDLIWHDTPARYNVYVWDGVGLNGSIEAYLDSLRAGLTGNRLGNGTALSGGVMFADAPFADASFANNLIRAYQSSAFVPRLNPGSRLDAISITDSLGVDYISARFVIYEQLTTTAAGGNWGGSLREVVVLAYDDDAGDTPPPPPASRNVAPEATTVTASTVWNATFGARNAVDNNTATRWSASATTPRPTFLNLTFDEPVTVYRTGLSSFASRITDFEIEYYVAGTGWVSAFHYQGPALAGASPFNPNLTAYFAFPPITSDQIRLRINEFTAEPTLWAFMLFTPPAGPFLMDASPRTEVTPDGGLVTLDLRGYNLEPGETEIVAFVGDRQYPATVTGAADANVTISLPANASFRDRGHTVTFTIDGQPSHFSTRVVVPTNQVRQGLFTQYNAPAPDTNRGWQNFSIPIGNGFSGANIFGRVDRERIQISEETLWTGGPINRWDGTPFAANVAPGGYDNVYGAFGNVTRDGQPATPALYFQIRDLALGNAATPHLPPAHQMISGQGTGAGNRGLFWDFFPDTRDNLGSFQNFAEVYIHMLRGDDARTVTEAQVSEYLRWLDVGTAVAGVEYEYDGVLYHREHFSSYPARVTVSRFDADVDGAVSMVFNPTIPHMYNRGGPANFVVGRHGKSGTITTEVVPGVTYAINLEGMLRQNGLRFAARFELLIEGDNYEVRTVEMFDAENNVTHEALEIIGADSVTIFKAFGTDYINEFPTYRRPASYSPLETASTRARQAAARGYDAVLAEHIADFQSIFNLADIDLGMGDVNINDRMTNDLLIAYRNGSLTHPERRAFERLHFQYGRYLMISSSRPGSLPANLQGGWNVWELAPWSSDFHLNVNLQMNYWSANATNMGETMLPLLDFIDSLRRPGRDSARLRFGVGEGYNPDVDETGWVVFHASNPFGKTGGHQSHNLHNSWGHSHYAPESGAWIMQNVYNIWQFYPCTDLLRDRIYPMLRETALFYSHPNILVYDPASSRLVMSPTYSAEHGPMWAGNTFQQQLIWQLFTFTIEAAEYLDVDEELRERLTYLRGRLYTEECNGGPVPISPLSGYHQRRPNGANIATGAGTVPGIREWWWETGYGRTEAGNIPGFVPTHRHLSHLTGLYPGNLINMDTEVWMEAAIASLNARGDAATGWSRGRKTNLWARTGDGDRAFLIYEGLIRHATLENLWGFHTGGHARTNASVNDRRGGPIGTTQDIAHPTPTDGTFQIDANFGGTAGVAEMLIQSHENFIRPLPAVPSVWANGSARGLTAVGGFVVDMQWSDGALDSLQITSSVGRDLAIRYGDANLIHAYDSNNNRVARVIDSERNLAIFETVAGGVYTFEFSEPTAEITVDPTEHTFPSLEEEYTAEALTALTVTVANTGTEPSGQLTVALTGDNADSFQLSEADISSIAVAGNATFTVTPLVGLTPGTHTATVTVSGADVTAQTLTVTFVVTAVQTFTVTVNGSNATDTGAGDFRADAIVTIRAGAAPAGYVFNGWTTEDNISFVNAAYATTSFIMPAANVSVLANWLEADIEIDRTELAAAIEAAEAREEATYTPATWEAFAEALTAAEAVYADADATQTEINAATQALITAMNALTRRPAGGGGGGGGGFIPPPQQGLPGTPFTDVNANASYANAIRWAYQQGLMNGTSATTFEPHIALDRAMLATILHRHADQPQTTFSPVFSDVGAGQWYSLGIVWASEQNVVNGVGGGRFAPTVALARQELAVMLHRYAAEVLGEDMTVPAGAQVPPGTALWAADAMRWALHHNLLVGTGAPGAAATRADVAEFLHRFFG